MLPPECRREDMKPSRGMLKGWGASPALFPASEVHKAVLSKAGMLLPCLPGLDRPKVVGRAVPTPAPGCLGGMQGMLQQVPPWHALAVSPCGVCAARPVSATLGGSREALLRMLGGSHPGMLQGMLRVPAPGVLEAPSPAPFQPTQLQDRKSVV